MSLDGDLNDGRGNLLDYNYDPADDTEIRAIRIMNNDIVREIVNSYSECDRELLLLRFGDEEITLKEIGKRLRVSCETVRKRETRILMEIKDIFCRNGMAYDDFVF